MCLYIICRAASQPTGYGVNALNSSVLLCHSSCPLSRVRSPSSFCVGKRALYCTIYCIIISISLYQNTILRVRNPYSSPCTVKGVCVCIQMRTVRSARRRTMIVLFQLVCCNRGDTRKWTSLRGSPQRVRRVTIPARNLCAFDNVKL